MSLQTETYPSSVLAMIYKAFEAKLEAADTAERPSVSTAIKYLGDAAAECRQEVECTNICASFSLAAIIENKIKYDEQQMYLGYIADATQIYLMRLNDLNRPTKRQIKEYLLKTLSKVTNILLDFTGELNEKV